MGKQNIIPCFVRRGLSLIDSVANGGANSNRPLLQGLQIATQVAARYHFPVQMPPPKKQEKKAQNQTQLFFKKKKREKTKLNRKR
jgi:hypothetical protein